MDDLLSEARTCEQVLLDALVVMFDDRVGSIENCCSRPVVLGHDYVGLWLAVEELRQVGSSPFVDRLVGVTYQEQVAMPGAQRFVYLPVQSVAVLHLVHHDITHLLLPFLAHFGEVIEDVDGEEDQVVEVQGKIFPLSEYGTGEQSDMVLSIDLGKLRCCVLRKQLRPSREQERLDVFLSGKSLCLIEVPQEPLYGRFLALQAVLLMRLLGDGLHVLLVEDLECLGVSEPEDLFAKELDAEGVDRTDKVAGVFSADQGVDPVAHLLRCLVREGQAQDVARVYSQLVDKVSVPICQHTSFAGARSGNYPYPSFGRLYGFQLLVVKSCQFHEFSKRNTNLLNLLLSC